MNSAHVVADNYCKRLNEGSAQKAGKASNISLNIIIIKMRCSWESTGSSSWMLLRLSYRSSWHWSRLNLDDTQLDLHGRKYQTVCGQQYGDGGQQYGDYGQPGYGKSTMYGRPAQQGQWGMGGQQQSAAFGRQAAAAQAPAQTQPQAPQKALSQQKFDQLWEELNTNF